MFFSGDFISVPCAGQGGRCCGKTDCSPFTAGHQLTLPALQFDSIPVCSHGKLPRAGLMDVRKGSFFIYVYHT